MIRPRGCRRAVKPKDTVVHYCIQDGGMHDRAYKAGEFVIVSCDEGLWPCGTPSNTYWASLCESCAKRLMLIW